MVMIYCVALPHQCEALRIDESQIITKGAAGNKGQGLPQQTAVILYAGEKASDLEWV